ncbi:hypothetical protein ACIRCZ_19695 [Leifsonia sp. NPDC102414]|uniref:hypothetical protein n=1 Tax=Leifsonia sp. NPDC102414 TaxID=3364124 RepID=UPI00380A47E1
MTLTETVRSRVEEPGRTALSAATQVTITRTRKNTGIDVWEARLWQPGQTHPLRTDPVLVDTGTPAHEVIAIATILYGSQQLLIALPWQETTPDTYTASISRI